MTVLRIESLVYGVEDVDVGIRYYDDWGVERIDKGRHGADYRLPSGQTIKLRSASDPTLPAPVEPGSTVRELVWGVDTQDALDALGAAIERERKVERDAAGGLHVIDPIGMSLGFKVAAALPVQAPAPGTRLNHPFWPVDRVRPLRVGHAVFFTPLEKIAETTRFYTDTLGFRVTDSVKSFGNFMRCGGSLDHHNLFLIARPKPGFNHAAFEVNNFDEIMNGGSFMEGKGWAPATKPGRHIMGSNLFWYFKNPSGGNTEYFSDMDVMDDGWQTRYHEENPGFAHWMMK